jgi:hypothetical protein
MRFCFESGEWCTRAIAACGVLFVATVGAGCAGHAPARNVAYDPFVPSAALSRNEALVQSVAYRGASPVDETVTLQEEHKEVIHFDQQAGPEF